MCGISHIAEGDTSLHSGLKCSNLVHCIVKFRNEECSY